MCGVLYALIWFAYKNQDDEAHKLEFVSKMFQKLLASKVLRIALLT